MAVYEQISVRFESKYKKFHPWKCIWKLLTKLAVIFPLSQFVHHSGLEDRGPPQSLQLIYSVTEHYSDVIMGPMASQIIGVSVVYSTVCSGENQREHQSSASLAFVRGIHRWPVNSPQKEPVTRKILPFDDVIMNATNIAVRYLSLSKVARYIMLMSTRYPNKTFAWVQN